MGPKCDDASHCISVHLRRQGSMNSMSHPWDNVCMLVFQVIVQLSSWILNNLFDNVNFFHELLMKKMVRQGTRTYKENWLKPKYSNNLVDQIIQMINLALLSLLLVCNATQPNSPNLRNSKFLNTTKKDKTKQKRKKKQQQQQQIWRKYWQFVWYLTKVDWQTSPKRRIPVGSSCLLKVQVYKA